MTRHTLLAATALALLASASAFADDAPPAAPAAPAKWSDTLKFGVQIEAGITANPSSPSDNLNFGQLFTDRANTPLVNQALVTYGRPLDPKATDWDYAFKLQGMYGTDARYTHFLRLFDKTTNGRSQFDIVEASVSVHAPGPTEGGMEIQAGLWPTPLGFETIDPSTNPFYSHSYIFNFGLPLKHSGVNAILHASDMIDLYGGVTAGANTIAGEDNNSSAGFLAGAKLTLMDGNLTVLGLSHIGPENATRAVANADNYNRYYNVVDITYKANDKLTFTTEINFVRDDFFKADAYGLSQYAAYTLTDTITLNGRAEAFRDARGFYVGAFPTTLGPVLSQEGYAAPIIGYGGSTYGELTVGATWKPALPDGMGADTSIMVRPELRYDTVLAGSGRYNAGKDKSAVTIATDLVLAF